MLPKQPTTLDGWYDTICQDYATSSSPRPFIHRTLWYYAFWLYVKHLKVDVRKLLMCPLCRVLGIERCTILMDGTSLNFPKELCPVFLSIPRTGPLKEGYACVATLFPLFQITNDRLASFLALAELTWRSVCSRTGKLERCSSVTARRTSAQSSTSL